MRLSRSVKWWENWRKYTKYPKMQRICPALNGFCIYWVELNLLKKKHDFRPRFYMYFFTQKRHYPEIRILARNSLKLPKLLKAFRKEILVLRKYLLLKSYSRKCDNSTFFSKFWLWSQTLQRNSQNFKSQLQSCNPQLITFLKRYFASKSINK